MRGQETLGTGAPAWPTYLAPFKVRSFPCGIVTRIDAVVRIGLKLCRLGGWQQGWWRRVLGTGTVAERSVLLLRLIVLIPVLLVLLVLLVQRRLLERRPHLRLGISVVLDGGVLERRLLIVLIQLALFAALVLVRLVYLEGSLHLVGLMRLWRGQVARLGRRQGTGHRLLLDLTLVARRMVCSTIASMRRALARAIYVSFACLR